jgi:hypothetical protein
MKSLDGANKTRYGDFLKGLRQTRWELLVVASRSSGVQQV